MRLENVDLNLLMPLRALLEERSVSKAAARLHRSQPALSGALGRLRSHFNDPLLERRGNHYELTPLARNLLERTQSTVSGLERIFAAQAEFDPRTSSREYSIVSSDYGVATLGAPLLKALDEEAPNIRLRFHNVSGPIILNAPESLRDYDGLITPHGYFENQSHQDLFDDRWVCVVDSGNDLVGDTLAFDQLTDLRWVFTYGGINESSPAAKHMQMLGIDPRVDVVSPNFLAIPSLLRGTNRIALLQESLAVQFAESFGLRILPCPFDVVPLREAFWWHPVHDRHPEHIWFRQVLKRAVLRAGLGLARASGVKVSPAE